MTLALAPVPEPSSALLALPGLGALGVRLGQRRGRRQATKRGTAQARPRDRRRRAVGLPQRRPGAADEPARGNSFAGAVVTPRSPAPASSCRCRRGRSPSPRPCSARAGHSCARP
ncbi:MAG: PEP-CTERM sorting domain-containing protein [Rubrivivax sp.]|nr:PEP-CTERM sorting domain-containing protein [Rubrivivax sp.]NLZ40760.1 PEP-CTERM sorting domain-containing protein [Comamonadaceae bacterium]